MITTCPASLKIKHQLKGGLLSINMHLIFVIVPLNVKNISKRRFS